ncbi:MAG: protein kinase [Dokdonella sp.]
MKEHDLRYARAQAIAHEILDQPEDQHATRLNALCADDAALRREAEWLIAASSDAALDDMPPSISVAAEELVADQRIDSAAPGSYRLVKCLGEGGMGMVWLAERRVGDVCQHVALKRLRAGSVTQQTRFREEQRILAALNHPNIAHLIDAGTDAGGEPFLAMEYVEGEHIDRWCDTRTLDPRSRVALFLKVCAAVSYAHERLVIHRDLKPANILVDATGEPKLLDFGIARLLESEAMATVTRHSMTPAYASPEQIEGSPLGTATDVYSLGVVLYELIAGVRPFEHMTADHAHSIAILAGSITPPSQQLPRQSEPAEERARAYRVPADIDAIVLKALRREPAQRYASVREFAEDLERFLTERPVLARQGQWMYGAQRFTQRNRWPLAIAAALIAIVLGFTWRSVLADYEVRLQEQVADRTTEFLISTFSLSDPTRAGRNDFSAREVLDHGRARVQEELASQPRVRARLLEALGKAYAGINEGSAGAPLLEEAAQLNLDPDVNDPLAAARCLRSKAASILGVNGSSADAEDAAHRAFALVREHAAGKDLVLADAYATLALAFDAAGKEMQALSASRQALALREAGNAGPLVMAESLLNLCSVSSGSGQHAEAQAYCERSLSLYDVAGATRTNEYRTTLRQFESTLYYGGNYAEGLAITRQRIALTRELFGVDSAALAMDQVSFTERLAEQGLFDQAAASLAAGMPVILQKNGAHSTQYALAKFNAGWLKYLMGQFDAAVPLLRDALGIYDDAVNSRDNGRIQVLQVTLATALIDAGHADGEARSLLETVIFDREAEGPDAIGLPYARLPLASWHVSNGQYVKAETLLDQVEAFGSRIESELHARASATRASIRRAQGDHAAALRLDKSAYEMTLSVRGPQNPRTARYALAYARALRAIGDSAKARALETEYRVKLENAYPPDSAFRLTCQIPQDCERS